jgi:hypothetical protein
VTRPRILGVLGPSYQQQFEMLVQLTEDQRDARTLTSGQRHGSSGSESAAQFVDAEGEWQRRLG